MCAPKSSLAQRCGYVSTMWSAEINKYLCRREKKSTRSKVHHLIQRNKQFPLPNCHTWETYCRFHSFSQVSTWSPSGGQSDHTPAQSSGDHTKGNNLMNNHHITWWPQSLRTIIIATFCHLDPLQLHALMLLYTDSVHFTTAITLYPTHSIYLETKLNTIIIPAFLDLDFPKKQVV